MQWLCVATLSGLLSLSMSVAASPRQLRASSALLSVSRQGDAVYDWDYHDGGKSWKAGVCANNVEMNQSPVNLSTTIAAKAPDDDYFFFKYPSYEAPVKMVNDGRFLYTIFPNEDGRIGGFALGKSYPDHLTVAYYLHKMVIHTPSEHTYNGVRVPMELQLVHRKKDAVLKNGEPAPEDTAIVAFGFTESRDEASPFLRSLIDGGLPDQRGGSTLDNRAYPSVLKFSELYTPVFGGEGEKAGFWDYTGSLTQPPCSTGVRWLVRQQPLNAKRKTLKYFTDVVEKSSHGVESNARTLQIIGPRPVFPRYARNAVHMTVFDPSEPDAFKDAFKRVKEHQQNFQDALKADTGGSEQAMEAGASQKGAVLASKEYNGCMKALGDVVSNVGVANKKMTDACNLMKGSAKALEGLAGGPARLEAAGKHASAKKSCEDQTKVAKALGAQQATQQETCDDVKKKVEKATAAVALEKANKEAKEKA